MDLYDKKILSRIQINVPLVRRPWKRIAEELRLEECHIVARISELKSTGLIRRIGGIFSAAALGYSQALVAFEVPKQHLKSAGELVAKHPGVSHCYGRADEFNLWFTLAVSPESGFGLVNTVELLARQAGTTSTLILPAGRCFKLNVTFDFSGSQAIQTLQIKNQNLNSTLQTACGNAKISELHRRAMTALQADLPAESEPYADLARNAGLGEEQLFALAEELQQGRALRRYAAILAHRSAGANENVMVVWTVNENQIDQAGQTAAKHPAVSHCYYRPSQEGWPFSLYTMIHGRAREDCKQAISQIANATGLANKRELWTEHEFKKQAVQYFSPAESEWEKKNM